MKLKNSNGDQLKKTPMVTKLQKSNGDKTQNSNCDKTKKTQRV